MAKRVETDDKFKQCLGFEINEARACCPHGMILLDEKFTKIANKLVHRFHVVHNEELAHIAVNGKPPRADLRVGGDDNYFMTPNTVNEGLGGFGDYFDSVRHPAPFGSCGSMVQLHHLEEPEWLAENWGWHCEGKENEFPRYAAISSTICGEFGSTEHYLHRKAPLSEKTLPRISNFQDQVSTQLLDTIRYPLENNSCFEVLLQKEKPQKSVALLTPFSNNWTRLDKEFRKQSIGAFAVHAELFRNRSEHLHCG